MPGCSDDPARLAGAPVVGAGSESDPSEPEATDGDEGGAAAPAASASPAPQAPKTSNDFATQSLARGRSWVGVGMPYCGGPNGGKDVICGGTCSRTGAAARAEWDKYRSDCSGFVSFAWGLPAPGHTCSTLAPYTNDVSVVIAVADLAAGDALNSGSHVMLFGGWVDAAKGTATILQESRCGTQASEKTIRFTKLNDTQLRIEDTTGRVFTAIRKK